MKENRLIGRFKRNYQGFWGKYRLMIVVFVLAVMCDAGSTVHFLLQDGAAADEIHPGFQLLIEWFGPVLGPILGAVGKAVVGPALAICLRRYAWLILGLGIILSFWAAWYNVWGWETGYYPNFFRFVFW